MTIQTLPELDATYRAARRAMIERANRAGLTQTEAAEVLGVKPTALFNIIHRNGIGWRNIQQGRRPSRRAVTELKKLYEAAR